jgi:phosphoenolpyruvate-protein phosphotransferase
MGHTHTGLEAGMKLLANLKTASKGIAIGKAFIAQRQELNADTYTITPEQVNQEIDKFEKAVKEAARQLELLAANSDILKSHLELVKDITLYEGVVNKIRINHQNVQQALDNTVTEFSSIFSSMEDEYLKERSDDIIDIRTRLMRLLKGTRNTSFDSMKEDVIIIAENLVLSDTSYLNLSHILGFATEFGGITSHVSIIARSLELPALVGVKDLLKNIHNGDYLILDASSGKLIINPDENTIHEYRVLQETYEINRLKLTKLGCLPATTLDGRTIKICANVGSLEDIKKAAAFHIDSIGLFRTEFLYMNNTHFPTEEEQFTIYKEAALLCKNDLIIRTLDIGGDKSLPYFTFPPEENPFLGWRAIRISLEMTDIFKTQLRAILRASAFGKVKIMYPMIISLEELQKANEILEECKAELLRENIAFDKAIPAGIMIETPAAVMCAGHLAKYADFFSIGTNDLTQYTLAIDRTNQRISPLFDPFHPAVLQSIKRIIDAAHENGIMVGMCGEFAGEEKAAALLLGFGLDEFSMSPGEGSNIKNILRSLSYEKSKELAEHILTLATVDEVKGCLSSYS